MAGAERLSSMAQRVQVVLEDDLDGGKADETVTFGLDGTTYEIDLSKKNAAKLRKALAGYIEAGRKTSRVPPAPAGRGRRRASTGAATDRAQNKAIREWAKTKKIKLSDRGRIPATIITRYEAEAGR